ncbi:MAG: hypothetical protein V1709_12080 [Planctomycetota bacterium]
MTKVQALSEVFITAFRSLPRQQRIDILEDLLSDKNFHEDMTDMFIAWQRRKEKPIPYESVRNELKRVGRL